MHGVPDNRPLQHGDFVNIDVTAYIKEGYYGDTSAMTFIKYSDPQVRYNQILKLPGI